MLGVSLLVAGVSAAAAQTAGAIEGTITNEAKQPVSGAIVTAVGGTARTATPRSVVTQATGAFTIPNLPPGSYKLCVQAPGTSYLNPCHWERPRLVAVAAGQTTKGIGVALRSGSPLKVRVNDASKLLRQAPGAAGRSVMLMVATPGGFYQPLSLTAKDDAGSDHEVVVPFDLPVRVLVYSRGLALRDSRGASLAGTGATFTVEHKRAVAEKSTLRIDIAGLRP
jgi:hypothetical protein